MLVLHSASHHVYLSPLESTYHLQTPIRGCNVFAICNPRHHPIPNSVHLANQNNSVQEWVLEQGVPRHEGLSALYYGPSRTRFHISPSATSSPALLLRC